MQEIRNKIKIGPIHKACGEPILMVEGLEKGSWSPLRCGCGCWHSAFYFMGNKIICLDCGKELKK